MLRALLCSRGRVGGVQDDNDDLREEIKASCRSGRRRKVLLLGRPGVGKSSFVNSLGSAIANRQVMIGAAGPQGGAGRDNFTLRRFYYTVPVGNSAIDIVDVPGSEFTVRR